MKSLFQEAVERSFKSNPQYVVEALTHTQERLQDEKRVENSIDYERAVRQLEIVNAELSIVAKNFKNTERYTFDDFNDVDYVAVAVGLILYEIEQTENRKPTEKTSMSEANTQTETDTETLGEHIESTEETEDEKSRIKSLTEGRAEEINFYGYSDDSGIWGYRMEIGSTNAHIVPLDISTISNETD